MQNLGANDIYYWYMANVSEPQSTATTHTPDLKLNLISPCTDKHIKKYSPQTIRMVTETPSIYKQHIKPFIIAQKAAGRTNWVYNILEGRKEQEDIIYRESRSDQFALGHDPEGFLLLPDMNWDRESMTSLRILGIVERRDLLSLRDLKKKDTPWLRGMMDRMLTAVETKYASKGIERDSLKIYIHCKSSQAKQPNPTQPNTPPPVQKITQTKRAQFPQSNTITTTTHRPTNILPLPHPHPRHRRRTKRHPSPGQSVLAAQLDLTAGNYAGRA